MTGKKAASQTTNKAIAARQSVLLNSIDDTSPAGFIDAELAVPEQVRARLRKTRKTSPEKQAEAPRRPKKAGAVRRTPQAVGAS